MGPNFLEMVADNSRGL